MEAKTLTGARLLVYINGRLYGRCSEISWASQSTHKAIYGIDQADPFELAPEHTKVDGTMAVYRLVGDGGAQGAGIAPRYEDIPRGKYFNITLIDKSTDLVVFQSKFCVVQSEGWNVPARGIVTGRLAFEGIDWSNETKLVPT